MFATNTLAIFHRVQNIAAKVLLLATSVVVLNGCVNSKPAPNAFYYVLDPKPQSFQAKTTTTQYKVLPVAVPDYLNQPNLVLKLSDHQIKITNYHFWAEDLRQSIQWVLINELNQANKQASFTSNCTQCSQISLTLQHFYPTESGDVVLAGSYQIKTETDQQYSFSYTGSLNKGGFDEAVSVMRGLLNELVVDINKAL